MAFESEFLEFMPDTVRIAPILSPPRNLNGEKNHGDYLPYRCRISGKALSLRHKENEDTTIIYDMWLAPTSNRITTDDKVELPDDPRWINRYPIIFAVGWYRDEDGMHNTKVQFGWMYHRQGQ